MYVAQFEYKDRSRVGNDIISLGLQGVQIKLEEKKKKDTTILAFSVFRC